MYHTSIIVAFHLVIFEIALLHFKNDIFNSDRLLLTFCGFERLFAQIPHAMEGNDNGLLIYCQTH